MLFTTIETCINTYAVGTTFQAYINVTNINYMCNFVCLLLIRIINYYRKR